MAQDSDRPTDSQPDGDGAAEVLSTLDAAASRSYWSLFETAASRDRLCESECEMQRNEMQCCLLSCLPPSLVFPSPALHEHFPFWACS